MDEPCSAAASRARAAEPSWGCPLGMSHGAELLWGAAVPPLPVTGAPIWRRARALAWSADATKHAEAQARARARSVTRYHTRTDASVALDRAGTERKPLQNVPYASIDPCTLEHQEHWGQG